MGSGFSVWTTSVSDMGVTLAAQSLFSRTPVAVTRHLTTCPRPPTFDRSDLEAGRGEIRILLAISLRSPDSETPAGRSGLRIYLISRVESALERRYPVKNVVFLIWSRP